MTKTFYEVYRPKSPDERKFVDKHVTIKHADRNGNGDDLFNAKNIKKVDRKKERHGYEPGEDAKVYENKEQLESALLEYFDEIGQEISYEELQELAEELQEEVLDELNEAKYALYNGPNWLHLSKGDKVRVLSSKGSGTTQVSKMGIKTDVRDEHLKHINENLISELSKQLIGRYIQKSAQSKSDASFAQGLSKVGTKLNTDNIKVELKRTKGISKAVERLTNKTYGVKEETEQLDELSKGTLASYIKKAGGQTHNSVGALGMQRAHSATFGGMPDKDEYKRSRRVMDKRAQGIVKAVDRLTKENIDNIIDRYIKEEISLEQAFEEKISDLSENTQNLLYVLFQSLDEDNQETLFSAIDTNEGLNEALDFALNELYKATLNSYGKKAAKSAQKHYEKGNAEEDKAMSTDGEKYPEKQQRHQKAAAEHQRKEYNRTKGLQLATKKLTGLAKKGYQKEEVENLEELNSYKVEGSHKNQGHKNSYSYFAKNVAHAKSLYHEKHSKNDWEIKSVSKLKD